MKDLGYVNGWSKYPDLYNEAIEKGYRFREIYHTPDNRGTNTIYECKELGFIFHVDSSD